MDILRDDLFKNKYFVMILAFFGLIIAIAWLINYNSVESRCTRYAQGLGSMFRSNGNKMMDLQIKVASEPLIQDCINRGGPSR